MSAAMWAAIIIAGVFAAALVIWFAWPDLGRAPKNKDDNGTGQ